jgi:ornithine carbamoyltransferase
MSRTRTSLLDFMKNALILIMTASAILAQEAKPLASAADLQAEYTKALLDLANAQSGRLTLNEQVKKALAESDELLTKSQNALQAVLQKKATKCAAEKQQVDGEALSSTGLLTCTVEKK